MEKVTYILKVPAYGVGTPVPNVDANTLTTKFNLLIGIEGDTKNICNYEDTGMPAIVTTLQASASDIIAAGQAAAVSYLAANYNN